MVIGITGKSGSGKSFLSSLIKTYGKDFNYINVDEIGHQVLDDPDIQKLHQSLFPEVHMSSIDRKDLANIVFACRHEQKTKQLTDAMYEKMQVLIDKEIMKQSNCIIDWILLPHTKYFKVCDLKILIKPVSNDTRIEHVLKRDNISNSELRLRDSASITYDESEFDYVVTNNYRR